VHMLHTALTLDGPSAAALTRGGEAVGVALPETRRCWRSARARSCASPGRRRRARRAFVALAGLRGPASSRRSRRAAQLELVGRGDRRRLRARPSRSTAASSAQLAAEHELLVTIEEACSAAASARCVETLNEAGGAPSRIPARRRCPTVRHPRDAQAAARGDRLHRRADRRAGARRDRQASATFAGRRRAAHPWAQKMRASTRCGASAAVRDAQAGRRPQCSPARCGSAPTAPAPANPGRWWATESTERRRAPALSSRRGGDQALANALASSELDVSGRHCWTSALRPAASQTCLLQAGQRPSVALDVAYGELSWNSAVNDGGIR